MLCTDTIEEAQKKYKKDLEVIKESHIFVSLS